MILDKYITKLLRRFFGWTKLTCLIFSSLILIPIWRCFLTCIFFEIPLMRRHIWMIIFDKMKEFLNPLNKRQLCKKKYKQYRSFITRWTTWSLMKSSAGKLLVVKWYKIHMIEYNKILPHKNEFSFWKLYLWPVESKYLSKNMKKFPARKSFAQRQHSTEQRRFFHRGIALDFIIFA